MRPTPAEPLPYQRPALLTKATKLADTLRTLTLPELQACMHLSTAKAEQTHSLVQDWTDTPSSQRPAIDAFLGDIYSGLQVHTFSQGDREYANDHLIILSGLYGGLKALDSIHPYRLEMGYKLPRTSANNLYDFWGTSIASLVPDTTTVIDISAVEYTKAVLPHLSNTVISPKFLTISPKTGEPTFVTVHAKIARGTFAHWLIKHRIQDVAKLHEFNELGYAYDPSVSTPEQPVFVCPQFKGLGLSVRLS